jgi:YbaB/EbfC DNA-binding family protein
MGETVRCQLTSNVAPEEQVRRARNRRYGVPINHRDEVEQLLADYRNSRAQLATVHRTLLSIAESASSPDGLVTATVNSSGVLSALVIGEDTYRRYRPGELADTIVRTSRQAAALAGERARAALAPVLPPGVEPGAALSGTADLSPDEIDPPPADPAPADDEASYEETSWLNRTGR